ncbi:hypothetical protein EJF36_04925 [Bacillus sp. HMF5848]|uniref:hypothetical protein n=1 Tax=Bacillus sp. HMF5848 TaxID=2495421 RepID=UPI000F79BFF9|nr:hypothetical protein [Bacillus sp. HMF5848]RSK26251.1 hypothetical protein EJF36_04925 [Bacillus sp. HMF5848]
MVNWSQIREKGKQRFVLMFSLVLSLPLVIDYYIIKFLLNSFRIEIAITEVLIVWIICLTIGFAFALYGWSRMEKDWHENNSLFK